MNFFKKYELLRMVGEGEVKSFHATERETGRAVLFHMLPDPTPSVEQMTAKAKRLNNVIEVGEFGGTTFIVTEPVEPFTNLRDWIDRQVPDLPRASQTAPPAAEPGEFTQIFGGTLPPLPPKPALVKPFAVPTPAARPASRNEPGEFTRFFGAGVNQDPVNTAPPEPFSEDDLSKRPFEPAGEFTRMFGGTLPPAASQPPPAHSPSSSPFDTRLDFTRATPEPPASTAPAPDTGPSEFTRAIGSPPATPAPAAVPKPEPAMAEPTPAASSRKDILIVIASFLLLAAALGLFLYFRRS